MQTENVVTKAWTGRFRLNHFWVLWVCWMSGSIKIAYNHLSTNRSRLLMLTVLVSWTVTDYANRCINMDIICQLSYRLNSELLLLIESGRYEGLDRTCRICKCCNLNSVENEYHFLLVCPAYIDLRRKFLSSYYCHWPTVFKFVHIMSTHSSFLVNRVSQYLFHAFKRRDALM
jgi:hypothetical protein